MNPIVEKLLELISAGKSVVRVSGRGVIDQSPRKVRFDLADETAEFLELPGIDRNEYMRHWKNAAHFKRLLAAANIPDEPDEE